jgi:hypothetical protein
MKLGEALVKAGLITEEQLKLALERQIVFRGRIDTNIVELRFLDDEQLTRFLGKFLKLPTVTHQMIDSIPEEVIKTISKELVEKYRIIPFKKERTKLHVAMLNPQNVRDIDDLRFITGYEIIPYVITEIKLLNALLKYYGSKSEVRYIPYTDRFSPEAEVEDISREKIRSISPETQETEEDAEDISSDLSSEEIKSLLTEVKATTQDIGDISIDKTKTGTELKEPQLDTEEISRLIGALLSNALYTAKLYYAQQGMKLSDSEIENEVFDNWKHLSEKIRDKLLRK